MYMHLHSIEQWMEMDRPNREWTDDIKDWCRQDLHILQRLAQDRGLWKKMMKLALDTYGPSAHGS